MHPAPLDTFLSLWLSIKSPAELPSLLSCISAEASRNYDEEINDDDVKRIWGVVHSEGREWDFLHLLFTLQNTASGTPIRIFDIMVILLCWKAISINSLHWFFKECSHYIKRLISRRFCTDAIGSNYEEVTLTNIAFALYGWNDVMLWRLDEVLCKISFQRDDNNSAVTYLQAIGEDVLVENPLIGKINDDITTTTTTTTTTGNFNTTIDFIAVEKQTLQRQHSTMSEEPIQKVKPKSDSLVHATSWAAVSHSDLPKSKEKTNKVKNKKNKKGSGKKVSCTVV